MQGKRMWDEVEYESERDAAARTIQRILVKELDPITLSPIRSPFLLLRNGVHIPFDCDTLHDYIAKTGDARDPVTREAYAKHELHRIERVTGKQLPPSLSPILSDRTQLLNYFIEELLSDDQSARFYYETMENIRAVVQTPEDVQLVEHRITEANARWYGPSLTIPLLPFSSIPSPPRENDEVEAVAEEDLFTYELPS